MNYEQQRIIKVISNLLRRWTNYRHARIVYDCSPCSSIHLHRGLLYTYVYNIQMHLGRTDEHSKTQRINLSKTLVCFSAENDAQVRLMFMLSFQEFGLSLPPSLPSLSLSLSLSVYFSGMLIRQGAKLVLGVKVGRTLVMLIIVWWMATFNNLMYREIWPPYHLNQRHLIWFCATDKTDKVSTDKVAIGKVVTGKVILRARLPQARLSRASNNMHHPGPHASLLYRYICRVFVHACTRNNFSLTFDDITLLLNF